MMKTWKSIDKSKWEPGAWNNEPDKAQWVDEKTGLDCLIVRGPSGALCGYVGIPRSHKYHGVHYDDVFQNDSSYIEVHGGLTFSDKCQKTQDESRGVCHTGDVANENVWWLGFDCAHCGDTCPAYKSPFSHEETYKNFGYVKSEVEGLAQQLSEAA